MHVMKPISLKDPGSLEKLFRQHNFLYCQPKINGLRAFWNPADQTLRSSGNKIITSCPHIVEEILKLPFSRNWDGELYNPYMHLNDISGAVRKQAPSEASYALRYYVFDLQLGNPYETRMRVLNASCVTACNYIKWVPTTLGRSAQSAYISYQFYLDKGYEGLILRVPGAPYLFGRKVGHIYKMKPAHTMELKLIGFHPSDKELHADTFGSLILQLPSGATVHCSGLTEQERSFLWKTQPKGSMVTIAYDELSAQGRPLRLRYKGLRWEGDMTDYAT